MKLKLLWCQALGSIVSDVTKALVLVCPSPSIHSVLLRICLVIEWRLTFYFVHPSVPFFLNYIGNLPSVCLSVTNQYIPATFLFVILTMNNVLYLKLTLNVALKQTCYEKVNRKLFSFLQIILFMIEIVPISYLDWRQEAVK